MIEVVEPTPEHPLYLWWHLPDTSAGSVHVAGCEYAGTAGERNPENPEALDLQRRVRAEFDGCR
ncbi:hypothetical protein [Nocardia cyriacigeorgica]|uniref:hypothetical protein n=1 Tax=Nocardia cyriacigeorgica TaxID=135487 RepID=UPI0018963A46|nr:hypothetical protein [Nocardia cyriacigeorgica]MBF6413212.1 hypothetical protein [Nocardia cyriacigeorgica]